MKLLIEFLLDNLKEEDPDCINRILRMYLGLVNSFPYKVSKVAWILVKHNECSLSDYHAANSIKSVAALQKNLWAFNDNTSKVPYEKLNVDCDVMICMNYDDDTVSTEGRFTGATNITVNLKKIILLNELSLKDLTSVLENRWLICSYNVFISKPVEVFDIIAQKPVQNIKNKFVNEHNLFDLMEEYAFRSEPLIIKNIAAKGLNMFQDEVSIQSSTKTANDINENIAIETDTKVQASDAQEDIDLEKYYLGAVSDSTSIVDVLKSVVVLKERIRNAKQKDYVKYFVHGFHEILQKRQLVDLKQQDVDVISLLRESQIQVIILLEIYRSINLQSKSVVDMNTKDLNAFISTNIDIIMDYLCLHFSLDTAAGNSSVLVEKEFIEFILQHKRYAIINKFIDEALMSRFHAKFLSPVVMKPKNRRKQRHSKVSSSDQAEVNMIAKENKLGLGDKKIMLVKQQADKKRTRKNSDALFEALAKENKKPDAEAVDMKPSAKSNKRLSTNSFYKQKTPKKAKLEIENPFSDSHA
jgi:hypothetical protein